MNSDILNKKLLEIKNKNLTRNVEYENDQIMIYKSYTLDKENYRITFYSNRIVNSNNYEWYIVIDTPDLIINDINYQNNASIEEVDTIYKEIVSMISTLNDEKLIDYLLNFKSAEK